MLASILILLFTVPIQSSLASSVSGSMSAQEATWTVWMSEEELLQELKKHENQNLEESESETSKQRKFKLGDAGMVPGGSATVEEFAGKLIDYLAATISIVAIIGIMAGGVILMTAYGQDEQIQKGKSVILYSLLWLIFTISSYVIVSLVQSIIYSIK